MGRTVFSLRLKQFPKVSGLKKLSKTEDKHWERILLLKEDPCRSRRATNWELLEGQDQTPAQTSCTVICLEEAPSFLHVFETVRSWG